MSKISIVLSVILVVSGISADNADSHPPVSRAECMKDINQAEAYITDVFNKTPDSEEKMALQSMVQGNIKKIKEIIPASMPGSKVASHDIHVPAFGKASRKHIDCEPIIAGHLASYIRRVNELYKESTE